MEDDRFRKLEEALAFAQQHVEDLDGELRKLFERHESLEREVRTLRSALREQEADEAGHSPGASGGDGEQAGESGEAMDQPPALERSDDEIRRDLPPHWGGGVSD